MTSIGGSYNQIQDVFIDPFTTEDNDETNPSKKYENRKERGPVAVFSKRSRSRLNKITSSVNQDKVHPHEVPFMALTSPSVGWHEPTGRMEGKIEPFQHKVATEVQEPSCFLWDLEIRVSTKGFSPFSLYNIRCVIYRTQLD